MSEKPETPATLTTKQRRFVEEYIGGANYNATEAARSAGYSEKTAGVIGYENLRKPQIRAAIAARLDELSMTAEEVAKRLTDWGRGTLAPFQRIGPDGELGYDLSTPEAQANIHLIREVKVIEETYDKFGNVASPGRIELKLHDAKDATVQMGRIRGKYVDRHEHAGPDGGPIEVRTVRLPEVASDANEWAERFRGAAAANGTNGKSGDDK